MADQRQELQHRLAQLWETLKARGIRLTPQRLEVLREVVGSTEPPDAEAVFRGVRKRLPDISLDTVYRTLWLFTDLGLVTTLGVHCERHRFDASMRPHHHFVCIRCGKAGDFYCEELDQLPLPDSVRRLGVVEKTQVEVRGLSRTRAGKTAPP
ncbi:transcriptional repressor [bacterium]|nr:transcriptional repressor [bacterium]